MALPLLRAALITAWALCFLTALHEVTMSSLLYGPGSETLAVVVLNSADLGPSRRHGGPVGAGDRGRRAARRGCCGPLPARPCLTFSTSAA